MRLPRKEGLNIVPLVDIMLVLLAIVLSTASFIAHGQIKVNLPESSTAKVEQNDKKVIVTIDSLNNFFIDGNKIDKNDLKDKILQIDDRTQVQLVSDRDAKFSSFMEILDILKSKNHENFTIQTEMIK
ncbi:TonB system transport protein ExbD [Helicobacter sp. MIT 99-5507]|uniref:TonB system transport protein ExbD n=1 Tax=Helicobacter sp. MIT 99-5507 TaxID=152489 RepID=UPI000E1F7E66|nr:TonB system transport protein ExbD [Helicobacter sp. MIT 99-5507]RDU57817.1 TonB system transport protein ExbD [Helicobacter sp. MIT 99-5507]